MHADFLRTILDDPFDDTPRLVYADWLEEYGGDWRRAEFIRCNVKLLVTTTNFQPRHWLGFDAAEVNCSWQRGFVFKVSCSTPDFLRHAETLFSSQPITEVELTDKDPLGPGGSFHEPGWGFGQEEGDDVPRWRLPECLMTHLRPRPPRCIYVTREKGLAALSNACVSYGRDLAGLPPLKESKS